MAKTKSDFLSDLVKTSGNDYASTIEEGIVSDVDGFVDTGSYAFNALLSGSLKGGMPDNKILALAGESATGKTFFTMGMVKKFLEDRENAVVLYFDSEQAVTSSMFKDRGIDTGRVAIFPIATVEEFRHQVLKIVDTYMKLPKDEQKPMMIVLDSLGMLSTTKEVSDTAEGKEVRDMTRAQVVKATFRVLTLKLGKAGIPLVMTNHTYDVVGSYFPQKEMGGGCLVAGTKIRTSQGLVKIEKIKIGDEIKTLFGNKKVTDTFAFNDKEIYEIEMTDGSITKCSGEHKFMIETENGYGWVEAKNISEGMDLVEVD